MANQDTDLNGPGADHSQVVLLIIDMISDFEFEDGAELFKSALPAARKIAKLKIRLKQAGIPVIYVNNNFGKWREDFKKQVRDSQQNSIKGSKIVKLLKPDSDDYYVLKPKHSAFYQTTLELILEHLQAGTLILTGVNTDICILFTANDAYMRDYKIIIPRDCVAAVKKTNSKDALSYLARVLKADTRPADEILLKPKRNSLINLE